MEYQKMANLLDTESNQPSKFRTRNWVEINDESRGTYTSNDIRFKTTIAGAGNDGAAKQTDKRDKRVTFKNCAPFTECISRINNTELDNAQDIDIVMSMYNLIEYSIIIQKHHEVYGHTIKRIQAIL